MSWDEFVSAWARQFDGFDLRQASPARRTWMRAVYRAVVLLARFGVRPSSAMVIYGVLSVAVPVLAWQGGAWPLAAAAVLLCGLAAAAVASALTVYTRQVTRLNSFYRSLLDRLAEVSWLLAFALLGAHPAVVVCAAVLVLAHEYVIANVAGPGAGSGLDKLRVGTVGDRSTRVWLALTGLALGAAAAQIGQDLAAGIVTMVAFIWLTLALIGVGQLLAVIRKVLA